MEFLPGPPTGGLGKQSKTKENPMKKFQISLLLRNGKKSVRVVKATSEDQALEKAMAAISLDNQIAKISVQEAA